MNNIFTIIDYKCEPPIGKLLDSSLPEYGRVRVKEEAHCHFENTLQNYLNNFGPDKFKMNPELRRLREIFEPVLRDVPNVQPVYGPHALGEQQRMAIWRRELYKEFVRCLTVHQIKCHHKVLRLRQRLPEQVEAWEHHIMTKFEMLFRIVAHMGNLLRGQLVSLESKQEISNLFNQVEALREPELPEMEADPDEPELIEQLNRMANESHEERMEMMRQERVRDRVQEIERFQQNQRQQLRIQQLEAQIELNEQIQEAENYRRERRMGNRRVNRDRVFRQRVARPRIRRAERPEYLIHPEMVEGDPVKPATQSWDFKMWSPEHFIEWMELVLPEHLRPDGLIERIRPMNLDGSAVADIAADLSMQPHLGMTHRPFLFLRCHAIKVVDKYNEENNQRLDRLGLIE
ncbi:hypothetical protein B9Z55_012676 [Caenorhabditis nigoni]|uniref:SAM domain-containing protein n=1 Tax=Caenorhabditis nigoni TaxID=1611254 RepID=A0A2G5TYA2_9PELO|nr:hypothetical protein B9Z55_012676 [Caenorhabditis nigoni]